MSNFVTRSGNQLYLNGQRFRFSGINAYDLGYTFGASAWDVVDTFRTMQEMGLTVCRIHAMCMSNTQGSGSTTALEGPTPGTFNQNVWLIRDHVVQQASIYGIKLCLPLVNYYPAYGPKKFYTDFYGVAESAFYTDANCIAAFKAYCNNFITHVNSITGVMYRDDPAILCWETGNEHSQGATVPPWTDNVCQYIKSIDPTHLIMDGGYGPNSWNTTSQYVDIITDHFYDDSSKNSFSLNTTVLASDATTAANSNKVFVVGEYDWIQTASQNDLKTFLIAIEGDSRIAGDMPWTFFSRGDTNGWRGSQPAYWNTSGSWDVRYPGETTDLKQRITIIRDHAFAMQGVAAAAYKTPSAPVITSINTGGSHNVLKWRGADSATTYKIDRMLSGGTTWTTIENQTVTDASSPYTDSGAAAGNHQYRIRGYNLAGNPGPFSQIASASQVGSYLGVDTFDNRQLAESWDYSTDGQAWSVLSGSGNVSHLSALGNRGGIAAGIGSTPVVVMKLGNHSGTSMDGYVTWTPGASGDTVNIFLRMSDSTHYYSLGSVGSALTIGKRTGGSFVSLATTTVSAPTPGTFYQFHFQVSGTALKGKMWAAGTPEPTSWTVTATDSSLSSGGFGLGANPTTTQPVLFDRYIVSNQPHSAPGAGKVTTKAKH